MQSKGKEVSQRDKKSELFKITERMVKSNHDVVGEQYIRYGLLVVSDEDKKNSLEKTKARSESPSVGWRKAKLQDQR